MNEQNLMPPRPAKARGGRSGVGTGTISLLMIFTVLCFATLAMLSLSTAAANASMQDRGVQRTAAAAAAKGQAAAAVAELDAGLLALHQSSAGNPLDFYDKAAVLAVSLGWEADTETHRLTLSLPVAIASVDEETGEEAETVAYALVTQLELQPPGSAQRYLVLSQTSQPVDGWHAEDDGQLWIPE